MRTIPSWFRVVPIVALALTLAGCVPPPPPNQIIMTPTSPPPGALPCAVSVERSQDATIGPAGGVLHIDPQNPGRDHRLTVPERALSQPVPFRLVEPAASYVLVHVLPHGQQFNAPRASLTLSYARCTGPVPAPDRLAIYRWNPQTQQWDRLRTRPGPGEREVTAEIEHLSGYALAGG